MNMQFMESYKQVSEAAEIIYLNPKITYNYEHIITGVQVGGKTMMAVDDSTFQAFGRFNPNMFKAKECYIKFFVDNKYLIINALNSVSGNSDIDTLECNLFDEIHAILKAKTDNTRLDSYNRIRKPINLYLQHIAFMAEEIENRDSLSRCLRMPLDRVVFGLEPVFTLEERKKYGISTSLGFGQIKSKPLYDEIQEHFCIKAKDISMIIKRPFEPIYFDLFWNSRYTKNLSNLFYSNIKNMPSAATRERKSAQPMLNLVEKSLTNEILPVANKNDMNEIEKLIIRKMQMTDKGKFYAKYEKASLSAQRLLIKLISTADEKGIYNKATDTPDYRLVKKNGINNFCLITITSNYLKLHLQRNRTGLHSDILTFSPLAEGRHSGQDWIEIIVHDETELEEAFRLIYTIYQKN